MFHPQPIPHRLVGAAGQFERGQAARQRPVGNRTGVACFIRNPFPVGAAPEELHAVDARCAEFEEPAVAAGIDRVELEPQRLAIDPVVGGGLAHAPRHAVTGGLQRLDGGGTRLIDPEARAALQRQWCFLGAEHDGRRGRDGARRPILRRRDRGGEHQRQPAYAGSDCPESSHAQDCCSKKKKARHGPGLRRGVCCKSAYA